MSQPRFEIVRSAAAQPWHARFRAGNGRIVWSTEKYARRRGAVAAVEAITGCAVHVSPFTDWPEIDHARFEWPLEVRDVDDRPESEGSA